MSGVKVNVVHIEDEHTFVSLRDDSEYTIRTVAFRVTQTTHGSLVVYAWKQLGWALVIEVHDPTNVEDAIHTAWRCIKGG